MDFLKTARITAFIAMIIMMACFVDMSVKATGSNQSPTHVYDYAGILTEVESAALESLAGEYSKQLNVHFIILTIDDNSVTDLETYTRQFFEGNIAGVGGIYECAIMTVNMGTRRVANDFFGELRTMISDNEASVIREGYTPSMTAGEYYDAVRWFLDGASELIEKKYALYQMETPDVDPTDLVYDMDGLLGIQEYNQLALSAAELSEKTGVGHLIVILGERQSDEYLEHYASSFYKRNFQDAGIYDGALILILTAEGQRGTVSPFGSYMPVNSLLWESKMDFNNYMQYCSLYQSCQYYLDYLDDCWQAENLALPAIDPSIKIYDFAGLLTDEEENDLRTMINEVREQCGVDLLIVLTDISSARTFVAFQTQFYNTVYEYEWDNNSGNFITLILGGSTDGVASTQYINVDRNGKTAYKKIGYAQVENIQDRIYSEIVAGGGYFGACQAFISKSSGYLNSFLPDIRMKNEIGQVLGISAGAGLGLSALILLILRVAHGFGMKRSQPADNYLVADSFKLYYAKDTFLHSHTSRSQRSSDSSSGGGSGSSGSSGGGTSSRSEGGF